MRKIISVLLMLLMLLSTIVLADDSLFDLLVDDAAIKFEDFKPDAWYSEVMAKLTNLGGISGYPDGTIRPDGTVTKGEFTKMLIGTLGHEFSPSKTSHWSRPWVDKAIELDIIPSYIANGQFKDNQLDEPITRELMAVLVKNSVNSYTEEEHARFKNYKNYELNIADLYKVTYKEEVLQAYALGLISGYPDNTFRPQNSLTRAEASSVIIRVVDPKMRQIQEPLGQEVYSNNPEVQYINELAKRYPENSIVKKVWNFVYDSSKKPTETSSYALLVAKKPELFKTDSDYSIVLFDNHTDKDKKVLKEILKDLYPTGYEKVYKQAIATIAKHHSAEDVVEKHDNRTVRYRRDDGSIHLLVNRIGK